jgi:general L-amino acid transport system permease protein
LGTDASAACWAVLTERAPQLMFGFYPADLYWRPVLGFVIFMIALTPILFSEMPRKLLILTATAPFVSYWLIWGGTIWGPVFIALGFVLGAVAYQVLARSAGAIIAVTASILVPFIYWLFIAGPLVSTVSGALPIGVEAVESKQLGGFMLAIIIGLAGIILSLPLGILLALGRQSDLLLINKVSVGFIETIRGVPLIVWLFTASLLLNYFLHEFRHRFARDHHGDPVFVCLYRRSCSWWFGCPSKRAIRSSRFFGVRLLEIHAVDHSAASIENFYPRYREHIHWFVQRHHIGRVYRPA